MATQNKIALKATKLAEAGKIDEAIKLYNNVLISNPKDLQSLFSLSLHLSQKHEYTKALVFIDRFIALSPKNEHIWFIRGTAMSALNRFDEALESYQQALQINPNNINALLSLGVFYFEKKSMCVQALDCWERLLQIKPDHGPALSNRGALLFQMGEHELAANTYGRLITSNPAYEYGLGLYSDAKLYCCDWSNYDAICAQITAGVRANKRVCRTMAFMEISDSLEDHLQCARIFANHICPTKAKPLWQGQPYNHDRIRIAYISADFRDHPVGQSMIGVIERHDKTRFETIGISLTGILDNAICRRYVHALERFIDAKHMNAMAIANLIRSLEIDIAVDLGGYTAGANPDILAHRPAPIQVNYLGYSGTFGADFMDYILVDKHIVPEESKKYYSEKVVYLPDCYFPPNTYSTIPERIPTREEFGLPAEGFIFCSFSNDFKITPYMFNVWMKILSSVPGSVLWLMSRNAATQRNLRNEAAQRGVDPNRIIFATRLPQHGDHLLRYKLVDLFLDTFPYGAHTTSSDALRLGAPVVTCMGQSFISRVASSLLHTIGLPELITHSFAEYAALAVSLASDPERLRDIKAKLIANQATHPLFDSDKFILGIEEAYTSMYAQLKMNR